MMVWESDLATKRKAVLCAVGSSGVLYLASSLTEPGCFVDLHVHVFCLLKYSLP